MHTMLRLLSMFHWKFAMLVRYIDNRMSAKIKQILHEIEQAVSLSENKEIKRSSTANIPQPFLFSFQFL